MQTGRVLDIDHVRWWRQVSKNFRGRFVAGFESVNGAGRGIGLLGAENRADVDTGQDDVEYERRLTLFHELPRFFLALDFAGAVNGAEREKS